MLKHVLVVDDNALIRRALRQLLEHEADFEICGEAENGREAIEAAQRLRPDIIMLDLSMPIMNGLDAARAIKRLMPGVPLILFSAYSDVVVREEAFSAGISALVSKFAPVTELISWARSLVKQAA